MGGVISLANRTLEKENVIQALRPLFFKTHCYLVEHQEPANITSIAGELRASRTEGGRCIRRMASMGVCTIHQEGRDYIPTLNTSSPTHRALVMFNTTAGNTSSHIDNIWRPFTFRILEPVREKSLVKFRDVVERTKSSYCGALNAFHRLAEVGVVETWRGGRYRYVRFARTPIALATKTLLSSICSTLEHPSATAAHNSEKGISNDNRAPSLIERIGRFASTAPMGTNVTRLIDGAHANEISREYGSKGSVKKLHHRYAYEPLRGNF